MSASRTLLRKHKLYGWTRDEDGALVAPSKRIMPGTHRRRVWEIDDPAEHSAAYRREHEFSYHATKGHRRVRVPV